MAEAKPDQPPIGQRIDDMDVVTWRHAGLGYVLVGRPGDTDLAALGRRIVRTGLDQSSGIGMIGSLAAMSLQSS
jgi:hypothetical protein